MTDVRPLVLHVIHHLVVGGMENGLVNLINHMPADRFRHAVVCIEDYSDFRNRIARPDVEVIALHRSRIGTHALRRAIFKLCRSMRPSIVHSRNQSGLDALLPARLAGVRCNIHGEHGWDVDNIVGHRWKPTLLRRLHSPLVDGYIVVSKDLQRFLGDHVGIRASRISQIYNGVDAERFSPGAGHAQDAVQGGADVFRIGTVGRLQAVKDQATLLRAFAAASEADPTFRNGAQLVIAGGGPLLEELQATARMLGIEDTVRFEGSVSDVPRVLRALDLFVLPSLNEGISNTILEAMASGLPVVASGAGGNPELVEDGVVGKLFKAADVEGLARILTGYARDSATRLAHGRAARERALQRFSLDAMVSGYLSVYERLLATR